MERISTLAVLSAAALAALGAPAASGSVDAESVPNLKAKGTLVPEGDRDLFRFTAEAGTRLSLKLVAVGGADLSFMPSLVGPGQQSVPLDGLVQRGRTLSAPDLVLPASGPWTLTVKATGAGEYSLQLKAKVKGLRTTSLDVRGKTLGRPGGGETFVRRLIGTAGGSLSVDDPGGEFDGVALTVPAAALGETTGVTVSSSSSSVSEVPAGRRFAGPAIAVGPEGADFGSGILLTIPFDGALVPAGATAADLGAVLVDGAGPGQVVVPESADLTEGTVTVAMPRGCTAVASCEDTMPRLVGGEGATGYWMLSVGAGLGTEPTGNDSRHREFGMDTGDVVLRSDGTGTLSAERHAWSFRNSGSGPGPGPPVIDPEFEYAVFPEGGAFSWNFTGDGQGITIGDVDAPAFRSNGDGSVLVGRNDVHGWARGAITVCLRREPVPAAAALSGTWNVAVLNFGAMGSSSSGPEDFSLMRATGTIAFDGAGGARTVLSMRSDSWDGGPWHDSLRKISTKGPYVVAGDGTVLLDLRTPADSKAPVLRLRFGPRADVVMGTDDLIPSSGGVAVLGVRAGPDTGLADIDGSYRGAVLGLSTSTYAVGGGPGVGTTVPDFSVRDQWVDAVFDGTRNGSIAVTGVEFLRDPGTSGGVLAESNEFSSPLVVAMTKSGRGTFAGSDGHPMTGLASPDGSVVLLVSNPADGGADITFGAFVKAPTGP